MTERQREILETALVIIAEDGYGNLTMRALARASGMKLGALQYHFSTRDDLLRALVDYIADELRERLDAATAGRDALSIRELAEFMLDDTVDEQYLTDMLWPQLWAMEQVEPLVSELLEDVYAEYLTLIEQAVQRAGATNSRAEALCLMSLLEAESLFAGKGRRWESDRQAMRETILKFIDERYGDVS
jgi:AcrR family transcriptional regulator